MDLYMIRHGESLANFTGTHAGWAPVPLTEKGEAQAEAARRHVRNLTFDRLYVSDVRRAQQTADILFPGVPHVQHHHPRNQQHLDARKDLRRHDRPVRRTLPRLP